MSASGGGEARVALEAFFGAGLAAVDPERRVRAWSEGLAERNHGRRLYVLAGGKAAGPMARAAVAALTPRIAGGLVVTADGHDAGPPDLECLHAAHPLPDARSARAGAEWLARARALGEDDTLVVLLSGGASALLTTPVPGIDLADLRATTEALLKGGASIGELNAVRKHLTRCSGGRLAAATRARVELAAVSDVIGDDLATIGSGPLQPRPDHVRAGARRVGASSPRRRSHRGDRVARAGGARHRISSRLRRPPASSRASEPRWSPATRTPSPRSRQRPTAPGSRASGSRSRSRG